MVGRYWVNSFECIIIVVYCVWLIVMLSWFWLSRNEILCGILLVDEVVIEMKIIGVCLFWNLLMVFICILLVLLSLVDVNCWWISVIWVLYGVSISILEVVSGWVLCLLVYGELSSCCSLVRIVLVFLGFLIELFLWCMLCVCIFGGYLLRWCMVVCLVWEYSLFL